MRLLVINLIFIVLIGCSSNSDEKLINDRISLLSYSSELIISANLNLNEINLSEPKEIYYWSQSGQNPQNNLPHILSNLQFNNKQKIIKDTGNLINPIQPVYYEGNLCNVSNKGILRCISINNNEILFEIDLKPETEESYDVLRGGLAYFDERVILVDGYGQIKIINATDGNIIWQKNISLPILTAPTIYRGNVYFITSNNKIYALDLLNGEVKWSFQTIFDDKKSLQTGVPAAIENIIIAPFSNGEIIAFFHDTGNIIWSENASKVSSLSNFDIKDITANPVVDNDKIFTISKNGRLLATNLFNGSLAWSIEISGSNSPIISNNQLYIIDDDARLICLNKNSGEIYWISQIEKNRKGKKSGKLNNWKGPYLINSLLYLISEHGEVITVSPKSSDILSSKSLNISGITNDPIIMSKSIYLMDDNSNVYQLD